jgi:hypothetical protein
LSIAPAPLRFFERPRAEVEPFAQQDAGGAELLQIGSRSLLAGERDDLVAAAREHVDCQAADAAGRARDDDVAAFRTLTVLLHAMDRERSGVTRGADRHALKFVEPGPGSARPSRLARGRTRRNRRRGSRTSRSRSPGLSVPA